jgi:hypothetical protein
VSLDLLRALATIAECSGPALMFGTDLLSTCAARPFQPSDITLLQKVLGHDLASAVLHGNAAAGYRLPAPTGLPSIV